MKLMQNPNVAVQQDGDNHILTTLICSMGLLICMIVSIVGIKLKWFKHRLSFEHIPGTSTRAGSSSVSQNGNIAPLEGVFRRKEDADSFIEIERPKTLPPVRVRTTDLQIPVPGRQSKLGFPSSATQNNSEPPTPPPMPSSSSSSTNQRADNRSQKSSRSQASSRSKSSERTKKYDEPTSSTSKSSSPRKKKVNEGDSSKQIRQNDDQAPSTSKSPSRKKKTQDDSKSNQPTTFSNSHYSEVNKKRRDKDKEKGRTPPSGASYEPRAKPRNAQAGAHFEQTRHFEKLKDDKQTPKSDKGSRIIERRPTGFVRPSEEEMEALEKLSEQDGGNITLKLDGFSDNDEESQIIFEKVKKSMPVPEPRKRTSSEAASPNAPMTPPVAAVTAKPNDSWSAVARHRILTEELTKQHSALKPVGMDLRSNGTSEYRNPLSLTQSGEGKPRTMRDMKKTKDTTTSSPSQNDRVVLGQEQRDDTEA